MSIAASELVINEDGTIYHLGLHPDQLYPTDTLVYSLYIRDRAGHKSNIIYTPPIILLCQ